MTLIKATPEQQAQRSAERANYLNSTLDGHLCNDKGIYVDPVTGKSFLSRQRLDVANAATKGDRGHGVHSTLN